MNKGKKDIIDKIKKCFALGKSSNKNEAAAAIEKARKLMDEYQLTEDDIKLAEVSTSNSKTSSGAKLPAWVSELIACVARAFNCKSAYGQDYDPVKYTPYGSVEFIGIGISPELAKFTFDVLYRQLCEARKEFIRKHVATTTSKKRKTERADLFCLAWTATVRKKVEEFAKKDTPESVKRYMEINYSSNGVQTIDRVTTRSINDRDRKDLYLGRVAGEKVKLQHGVMKEEYAAIK